MQIYSRFIGRWTPTKIPWFWCCLLHLKIFVKVLLQVVTQGLHPAIAPMATSLILHLHFSQYGTSVKHHCWSRTTTRQSEYQFLHSEIFDRGWVLLMFSPSRDYQKKCRRKVRLESIYQVIPSQVSGKINYYLCKKFKISFNFQAWLVADQLFVHLSCI